MTTLITNKKIHLDFHILETFTAGVELFGHEVKSLKGNQGSLEGSHISVRGGEAYLLNSFIPPYQPNNTPKGYEPRRNRKLLLHKKEIQTLAQSESTQGLTIVPIKWYNIHNKIKLEIGIARGKKKADKREDIKKRDTKRELDRTLKNKY